MQVINCQRRKIRQYHVRKQNRSGDGMNDLLTKGKGGIENAFTYNEREQKLKDKIVKENHLVPQVFRDPFERKECDDKMPFSFRQISIMIFIQGKNLTLLISVRNQRLIFVGLETCSHVRIVTRFLNTSTFDVHKSCCMVKDYALESHLDSLLNPSNNQPKMHDKEKPYACSNCDFKSPNKDTMKNHMNSHKEKNIYMCDVVNIYNTLYMYICIYKHYDFYVYNDTIFL